MGKPYSDLEKRALAVLAGGGDPAASRDLGLANYWKWRINPLDDSHDLPSASERSSGRKLLEVTLKPFGLDNTVDALIKTTISTRSSEFFASRFGIFGIDLVDSSTTGIPLRLNGYKPARVYGRSGAGASAASRISRITKRKYKSYFSESDQGYSSPFGKIAGTSTQAERQTDIKTTLLAGSSTLGLVTFTPEKLKV
jgi:hypothetical protein